RNGALVEVDLVLEEARLEVVDDDPGAELLDGVDRLAVGRERGGAPPRGRMRACEQGGRLVADPPVAGALGRGENAPRDLGGRGCVAEAEARTGLEQPRVTALWREPRAAERSGGGARRVERPVPVVSSQRGGGELEARERGLHRIR